MCLSTQSVEHREPRLQYDRERRREARSDERLEHREARLQRDRESHREARSDERLEHREARLQCDRESHRESYREQRMQGVPLFQQHSVQTKMLHILLLWSCWDVAHAQKHFLVCTFTLDQVSVYAVGGTSVHPSCTPLAITWTLAPFQQLKTSTFGLMNYYWSLLLSSAIYYVSCPSTFISALLLSVHTHHFCFLTMLYFWMWKLALHDIALFKIWLLTPFTGI